MPLLGKLTKINDLRSIWQNEATNFTTWLSEEENLTLLAETIGIEIEFVARESSVGDFSIDILAREAGSNKTVIIENQLEKSDHTHLGQIITYASGTDASYIIWIVNKARDEHRKAIEWLNNNTGEGIGFFLLEIELWKINDSIPAPKFNIVERPNNWAKEVKSESGTGRRPPFSFSECKIKSGEIIELDGNPDIKAIVVDDRRVEYNGERLYLTTLTKRLLNKPTLRGPEYWLLNGVKLTDIRDKMEREEL